MAGKITLDRMDGYFSAGLTGTGSAQNIAHGLQIIPFMVLLHPRDNSKSAVVNSFDASNVNITVANGAVYDLIVFTKGN